VKDFDEAIKVANDVQFGLSASLSRANLNRALDYVSQIEAGLIALTAKPPASSPRPPSAA